MLSYFFWIIFGAQCLIGFSVDHDFHLSKCDIHYNIDESALQISLNLFIDDLETALSREGNDSLSICTPKEVVHADSLIHDYIMRHLRVKVDNADVELGWVGKEISEDFAAVWTYLEITNVNPQKIIEIENDLLMEIFEDQQNLVKLVMDKKRRAFFLFNYGEYGGTLDLE